MAERHMYYSDPEKFDLSKMRTDAYKVAQGDQFNQPQTVTIHYHAHEVPCKYPEGPHPAVEHEVYAAVIGEDK